MTDAMNIELLKQALADRSVTASAVKRAKEASERAFAQSEADIQALRPDGLCTINWHSEALKLATALRQVQGCTIGKGSIVQRALAEFDSTTQRLHGGAEIG